MASWKTRAAAVAIGASGCWVFTQAFAQADVAPQHVAAVSSIISQATSSGGNSTSSSQAQGGDSTANGLSSNTSDVNSGDAGNGGSAGAASSNNSSTAGNRRQLGSIRLDRWQPGLVLDQLEQRVGQRVESGQ